MSKKCPICGKPSSLWVIRDGKDVCCECDDRMDQEEILERSKQVKEARDLKSWSGNDMSELFWLTFIEYRKNPTRSGIELINRIFLWSCHANHTLSNTIHNTFKWCKMDLFCELNTWRERSDDEP